MQNRNYRRTGSRPASTSNNFNTRIKKSRKTMDVILVILAIIVIAFTITMIIIFVNTGSIPDTLVGCVFAACTGELGVMGWIKSTKDKYLNKELEEARIEQVPAEQTTPTESDNFRYDEEVNFFE